MPLLKNPDARWDHPALTQVRARPCDGDVHGLQRSHRASGDTRSGTTGKRGTELYDEVNDPDEPNNLADDPARKKVVAEMRRLLERVSGK